MSKFTPIPLPDPSGFGRAWPWMVSRYDLYTTRYFGMYVLSHILIAYRLPRTHLLSITAAQFGAADSL